MESEGVSSLSWNNKSYRYRAIKKKKKKKKKSCF